MSREFDLIRRYLAPLTQDTPGAFNLTDDAATLSPSDGCELVVTTDTVVAGVHFLADAPPNDIVAKLIGSNLSDLAAMGAKPAGFTVSCGWPPNTDEADFVQFADAMRDWIAAYAFPLLGGDTVAIDGPQTFTLTAFGEVGRGSALRRNGAAPGDAVYVTGTIGDSALGLLAAKNQLDDIENTHIAYLAGRYRNPQPRIAEGQTLVGIATSCIDISDGLIQDLGHIAETSGVGLEVEAALIPLSDAAREATTWNPELSGLVYSGGDDYELAFTASPEFDTSGIAATKIGTVIEGEGVQLFGPGKLAIPIRQGGYSHL